MFPSKGIDVSIDRYIRIAQKVYEFHRMASNLVVKRIFPCRIVLRLASTDIGAVWRYVSVNRLFLVLGWVG